MNKKSYLSLIVSALVLMACNGVGSNLKNQDNPSLSQKQVNTVVVNPVVSPYRLGGTYDTLSNSTTNTLSCLNVAYDESNLTILNPQATLDFTQEQTLKQVQRALDVDFAMHINLGIDDVNIAYHYANTSQDDSYTLNLNYIYQYSGIATFKQTSLLNGESELTPAARAIVKSSPQSFRQMCGDKFIEQLDAGTSVLIRLTLRFDSASEKNYYVENMTQITGLQNVLDIISKNPKNVAFSLVASGIQVGGNPEVLNQLFITNGGIINAGGYPELNCGNASSDSKCVNIINQVITYANGLKKQLQNPTDYYLTNPVLASWQSIGINPGDVGVDSKIIQAMQELNRQYSIDLDNNNFINNSYAMLSVKKLLSEDLRLPLTQLMVKYQNLMALYKNKNYHLNDCFHGFVSSSCINIHDQFLGARSNILNDDSLNKILAYLKDNQYQTDLLIDPRTNQSASCILNPISLENNHQFAVNCNGQISTGINNIPITLQQIDNAQKLIINNLAYSYKNASLFNFNYTFNQPLNVDSFYENKIYIGDPLINSSGDGKAYKTTDVISIGNF